jgi:hypothetical protein
MLPILKTYSKAAATAVDIINKTNVNINEAGGRVFSWRIQDFKLGGAHLKKLPRAEVGAKIVGVFRVKNHDFTPKKSYFYKF